MHDLATPALAIDSQILARNIQRVNDAARAMGLALRPHTKTHKSLKLARLQLGAGASGLTVAKAGEARVFSELGADLLLAYPTVDAPRCTAVAELAREHTVRVALDSEFAAKQLAAAAFAARSTVGVLVDLDVGMHRTGVATPADALLLAQRIDATPGLRLDGLFFYPGHIPGRGENKSALLEAVDALLAETLGLWEQAGLAARIVSGGSTPTAMDSHRITRQTEIRPGTYVFNDMNCVAAGIATLDDCAARIYCTVVSNAVSGQVVLDGGTKTLTSDRCGPAPDSGHGHIVEYPDAVIAKLTEEHAQVDVTRCARAPELGERVSIVPNHICPCVNLQDRIWLKHADGTHEAVTVDARGKLS
jgi:D-serine deaminase-like pyridoxal phosphate-dependent protein